MCQSVFIRKKKYSLNCLYLSSGKLVVTAYVCVWRVQRAAVTSDKTAGSLSRPAWRWGGSTRPPPWCRTPRWCSRTSSSPSHSHSYRAAPHTSLSSHLDVGHRAAALADHELVEEDVLGDGEPGALGEEVVPDQTPQSSLQLSDLHPGQSLSQAETLQRVFWLVRHTMYYKPVMK